MKFLYAKNSYKHKVPKTRKLFEDAIKEKINNFIGNGYTYKKESKRWSVEIDHAYKPCNDKMWIEIKLIYTALPVEQVTSIFIKGWCKIYGV